MQLKLFHKFAKKLRNSFMKKILFLIPLFPFLTALSQEEDSISLKKSIKDKLIVDVTIDNWLSAPKDIHTNLWSPGISVSAFNDIRFGHSPFGFAFGIGLSSHNVHSNGIFIEKQATDSTPAFTSFVPRTKPYSRNKISSNYIEIPFEFRYRTAGNRPFRFYPGFKFGYLVNIHTKFIDDTGKWKFFTFPNSDPLRYGVTARIGFGIINFFGFYGLNSLFKTNKGSELIPWSIGTSVVL